MGLFKRINDIITANISEMVERHEEPEKLLKQAVHEMEDSIRAAEQETAKVLVNEKKLKRELASNETAATQWSSKAEVAVDAGDDDLARRALRRKQEHDNLVVALRDQVKAAEEASLTLKHQLDGMNAKMAEAKRNLATLSARKKAAEIRKQAYAHLNSNSDVALDDAAFQKFERMREKVEHAEAEAEAMAELRGISASAAADRVSEQDETIDAELAALKSRRESR